MAIPKMVVTPKLGQWLYIPVSIVLLVFLKTEGSDDVELTFIESAVAKGAVCLDGSPPAYQFDKGVGGGVNDWLVYIQGGGWCYSVQSCTLRMNTSDGFGSSKLMQKFNFTGILSNKQEFNPDFYNWNRIFVRYCDGSAFTGDVEKVDPATKLHFRGARVFKAIMEELLAKGMKSASRALLCGCSAGGLASIFHCDMFRALLPTSTKVKCVSDAGYFVHVKDISGKYRLEKIFEKVVKLHGSAKNLPPSCSSKMRPGLCFYPEFVLPQVQTQVFVLNSAYDALQVQNILAPKQADPHGAWSECKMDINKCLPSQLKTLQEFRSDFLRALWSGIDNSSCRGMFINSCYIHCQTRDQISWLGDPASKLDNKSIAEAVGDWYYERSMIQRIDNDHNFPQQCGI